MIRVEATRDGKLVTSEPFNDFNEIDEMKHLLQKEGLKPSILYRGRGGYYKFEVEIDGSLKNLHVYLKKVTFGGREARPYEKRAQFSAALDREGYESENGLTDLTIIVGLYKADKNAEPIICTWNIEDWGTNIGRAFNCFTDVHAIAEAYSKGFSQHKTSIGQITCCFQPNLFPVYLKNRRALHTRILDKEDIHELSGENTIQPAPQNSIPKFDDLFQLVMDVLHKHEGIASIVLMELEVSDELGLSEEERLKQHNPDEGARTELGYQLAWARYYLKQAGFITSPKRKIWSLTELGYQNPIVNKADIKRLKKEEEAFNFVKSEELSDIEEKDGVEVEIESENEFIEHPFDPNLVDIRTRSMSLDLILKRLNKLAINMDTSFQRKAGLWTATKQSRLIESILVKIPLPVFYFDGSDDDNWLVVDGLQRLSSLDNFVNKESFKLINLEFLSQFNGKKFSELPSHLQRRIEEFEITAYIIAPGTPKTLKFNVFKRINTGGLTLTSQEIRNALNQGIASEFVKRLADLKSFKIATDFSISEDRMLDREFVTRFLTFYLFPISEYTSDLDFLLNKALEAIAEIDHNHLQKIAADFDKAMHAAYAVFDKYAFRKRFNNDSNRKPINKALFEVWSVLFSKLSPEEVNLIISKKKQIQSKFTQLLETDEEFNRAISSSTNDKTRVKKRFETISELIKSTLS